MNEPTTKNKNCPTRRTISRVGMFLILAVLLGAACPLPSSAQTANALEYEVKGAFLVKFGMFVEWPTNHIGSTNMAFLIGILGEDPFGTKVEEALKRESIFGRAIQIKRGRVPTELSGCQIVFINGAPADQSTEWLAAFARLGVLTVSDEANFASRGGMIGFVKEEGKIRFEINQVVTERAGLKLSSKLLQVGKKVDPQRKGPE